MRTLLVKLLLLALISGLLIACAQQSRSTAANSGRWPFSVHGQLTDSDIAAIVATVRRVAQIEHNIAWIDVQTSHRIRVYTGHIRAPLAGGGNVVEMKKLRGKWTIIGNPQMSAWNA